jgi:hypothetical protein
MIFNAKAVSFFLLYSLVFSPTPPLLHSSTSPLPHSSTPPLPTPTFALAPLSPTFSHLTFEGVKWYTIRLYVMLLLLGMLTRLRRLFGKVLIQIV